MLNSQQGSPMRLLEFNLVEHICDLLNRKLRQFHRSTPLVEDCQGYHCFRWRLHPASFWLGKNVTLLQ
jgi:hypothetical protein